MMKKRFMSGKIGLYDLVPTEEGREKYKVSLIGESSKCGWVTTALLLRIKCVK